MLAVHKFGIIDAFDKEFNYKNFSTKDIKCIFIEDETIQEMSKYLVKIKTYYDEYSNEDKGLNYKGVTIFPVSSLMFFHDIVSSYNRFKKSKELSELTTLILDGKIKGKYIIHIGV